MERRELLLIMTVCKILGHPTNPAQIKMAYEMSEKVLQTFEHERGFHSSFGEVKAEALKP
jgi:hypothetical protein